MGTCGVTKTHRFMVQVQVWVGLHQPILYLCATLPMSHPKDGTGETVRMFPFYSLSYLILSYCYLIILLGYIRD